MKRKASLVLVAMMVGVLGMVGCNKGGDEAASEDGTASAAATESPAAEPAAAAPASEAPVAASHGGPGAAPVITPADVGPVLGEAASFVGRTAARARAAYERWERRHEKMRERRDHRRERRDHRRGRWERGEPGYPQRG